MSDMQLINDMGTIREYTVGDYTIRLYDYSYAVRNTNYVCRTCTKNIPSVFFYNEYDMVIYTLCKSCNEPYDLFNKNLKKRKQGVALLKVKKLI